MKVSVIISTLVDPVFPEEINGAIHRAFNVDWITNPKESCQVVEGRHMTQAKIDYENIPALEVELVNQGKSPRIIGVWNFDTGKPVVNENYDFDRVEYVKYLKDIVTFGEDGNEDSRRAPTSLDPIRQFTDQAPRWQSEDPFPEPELNNV